MHTVIAITLADHDRPWRVHDDAHDALRRYLDRAEASLTDDPGRSEVVADLERSIGEKLATRLGAAGRVVKAADIDAVLEEIGPVHGGDHDAPGATAGTPRGRRRLYRIREGQEIAGVRTGLSAYAQISVDWVRWTVVLLTLATVGLLALVYIVLVLALPVVGTRDEWVAALDR